VTCWNSWSDLIPTSGPVLFKPFGILTWMIFMMKMLLSSRWKGPSEFLPKMQGDKFEYIFFILIHILPRLVYDVL